MRPFEYRSPRAVTVFDIEFLTDGATVYGRCKDFSATGIRAQLERTLAVGRTGLLTLRHPARVLKIDARLSHAEGRQVGFTFLFGSTEEQEPVTQFAALINGKRGVWVGMEPPRDRALEERRQE
ncbi:MAG: PilZ domain-containing protein [Acidobacteriota bacterium]|nr:PilZ domain-containing protein [Acidobacteriota bacterium]